MALSLYDAFVPSAVQVLGAVDALVGKAAEHAAATGVDEAELIGWKLADDMLPFGYQVKSCVIHSVGAIEGMRAGSFSPDMGGWPQDCAGLRAKLADAIETLETIDPAALDAAGEGDCTFRMGELALPFSAGTFLLSFSQPNFYFHASIAYAILRARGIRIGKRDFLGRLRIAA